MGLSLEIVSRQRNGLGEIRRKEFGQDGGTIGRSLSNDWALPDKKRYLSAKHAAIDFRSGSYYIVDTSTNGVFVNESETPVGRGKPQRLFNGDRIRIGEYLIVAKIETGENTMDALVLSDHVDPVDQAQRVDSPDPTSYDLIDENLMTGVGIEIELADSQKSKQADPFAGLSLEDDDESLAFGEQSTTVVDAKDAPAPRPKPAASPEPSAAKTGPTPVQQMLSATADSRIEPAAKQPAPPPAAPAAKQSPAAEAEPGTSALAPFFRGAGLPDRGVDDQQAVATLFLLGQLMREFLTGLAQNLHGRSQQKNSLRLNSTTIQPKDNNPLKFSAGADEALENLLFRELSKEYLGPVEAVRESFKDLHAHQAFLLKAMGTAVSEYIGRLDPDVLEEKFARSSRGGLMSTANKLKYWDLYRDLYQVVAQREPGRLPAQFLEELAHAYETEAERDTAVRGHDRRKAHTGTGG